MSKEQFDKKIDQLARKAVEHAVLPYTEDAWDKMEQLLDKKDNRRRFIVLWWAIPMLFFIGTTIYFWNKSNSLDTHLAAHKALEQQKEKERSLKTEDNKTTNLTLTTLNTNNNVTLNKIDNQSKGNSTNIELEVNKKDKTIGINQNKSYTPIQTNKVNANSGASFNSNQATVQNANQNENEQLQLNTNTVYTKSPVEQLVPIVSLISAEGVHTINGKKNIEPLAKKTAQETKQEPKNKLSKFGFGVLVESDITSANFKKIDQVSTGVGVGVSYDLSSKLSLFTGFAVSKKVYAADSTTYKNAESPAHYLITGINAKCLVFDIPFNLQYKFKESKQSSWLATAGLSSYIMKKEDYDYNYLYYGQYKTASYSINNKNAHFFSILNLSAAYRRGFNKNMAWQIAPFAKIPLTGIGNGKVNLYSVGLEFSVLLKPKAKQ